MTPTEAIEILDGMQKIPGRNLFFSDIAGVIRELDEEVILGRQWKKKLKDGNAKLTEACKLVLLFHSGSPWDVEKQIQWQDGLRAVFGNAPHNFEATTKNLCAAVRAALESK